jgi:hypothetical protein
MRRLKTAPRFFSEGLKLLEAFAEKYFRLHLKNEDGVSEADGLNRALENLANRKDPAFQVQRRDLELRLEMPEFPEEFSLAWNHFMALHRARGSNGFGINALSFSEIDAYIKVARAYLLQEDILAIQLLDAAFMRVDAGMRKAAQRQKSSAASNGGSRGRNPTRANTPPRR